ncbi:alpha/beta fold hydrolase [Pleomorphomonas oryzae]|uniref:alpha/beta fold hydrolase n=1 Tax=Pleomorphomonas oryzae TaxID=261934 RepID=UPI00041CBD2D|nr:alpha/beta fold hydrolase [Pleomorphomonas oryzae]
MSDALSVFSVPVDDYRVHVSHFGPTDQTALLLHGGGSSSSDRIFPLREDLAQRGIGTLALDHLGHGRTGGDLARASLQRRVEEVLAAIDFVKPSKLLGSVSMSMGGYVAVRIHKLIGLPAMVLIAPAMYDAAAYPVPFGAGFTDVIRAQRSYDRSDAWDILADFTGSLLVVAGRDDEVIPREVIHRCHDAAKNAARELVLLEGIDHFVMTRLRAGPRGRLDAVLDRMAATLSGDATDTS